MDSTRIIPLLLALACASGCSDQPQTARRAPAPIAKENIKEDFLRALEEAEREAAATTPPKPTIALPELDEWVRSEPRSLPPEEQGFSVAYDHPSGVSVTFYQLTRGISVIPDDLGSGPTQDEMARAKSGIEQAVQFGIWQAAKETDNGIVPLGDSTKQALWSCYEITVEGNAVKSETYVWSHNNSLFKVRATGRSHNPEMEKKALSELLTAMGDACRPVIQ
jgi:hypothetical protein